MSNKIKHRSSSRDDQTYYDNTYSQNQSYDSDVIDVDFKVVDEEDTH
ncbi:MAG: hypothetical protein LUF02_01250 [Erysipelotrichaceae bacterium]|nr:hypothetical protein [Erysipelotrichaceae bacterium]